MDRAMTHMRISCLWCVGSIGVLLIAAMAWAVNPLPQGDSGYDDAAANVFIDGEITLIDVTMNPVDLQYLIDHPYEDDYMVCSVRVYNSAIDETIDNVGIRPRGNTSRSSKKKSWKLSFNKFVPGREFHGLEKFNVNGEHNDVSITRSKLAWDLYKEMGVPSPRAHHVQFKINDGALVEGVHVNVEQIDDEFVDAWFSNNNGNLYKCRYQGARADLRYVSPGTAETYEALGGGETYVEEINEDAPDFADLAEFIAFINSNGSSAPGWHMNGVLDGDATQVAVNGSFHLWAGVIGDVLYVATESASATDDHFLFLAESPGSMRSAPWGKYGDVAGWSAYLGNEADNGWSGWFDHSATAESIAGGAGGVLEGTINLSEEFGGVPATIYLAVGHYETDGGGLLIHTEQVPAGNGNWDIESAEYVAVDVSAITVPSKSSKDSFAEGIVQRFSVDNFLRAMAVDVAVGQWDNYWYGANNYYLYHNEDTNRFEYIPYDYDNTYGIDFFGIDWATRSYDTWGDGGFGSSGGSLPPLIERILAVPHFEEQFRRYLRELAGGPFALGATETKINAIQTMLTPYAFMGSYSGPTMDWDYTAAQFGDSYTQPTSYRNWGSGWDWGLKPYIQTRATDLLLTVPAPTPLPRVFVNEMLAINNLTNVDEMGEPEDWVELYNDESTPVDVGGMYLSDDPGVPTSWRIPDGTTIPGKGFLLVWCDDEPGDGVLHATFKLSGSGEGVSLFHDDAHSNVLIDYLSYPSLGVDISYGRYPDGTSNLMEFTAVTPAAANDNTGGPPPVPDPTPPVFINEWMASNDTTIQDDAGEYEDWVELYNAGDVAVDLGGRYLTDDLADKNKWRIPDGTTIAPRGYLLIWADDDGTQGPLHTSFKLSASGESIGLFDRTSNYLAEIDALSFGAQTTDISEGRLGDGTACIAVLRLPTPEDTNMSLLGDFDDDGDVDLVDHAELAVCLAGPGEPITPACGACVDPDLDNDGDADLADFAIFQENVD